MAARAGSVKEGFTRLDALNRIGNTVFGKLSAGNIAPTNAPVNYPHIWSTSWFDWVQYDGSIMQPMVRNAGEAMGLKAPLQLRPGSDQYASSIKFENLYKIETLLAGKEHPQKTNAFMGLKAPEWPEKILGEIDKEKAREGASLYDQHCARCHRPPINSENFWSEKYWNPILPDGDNFYRVRVIPVEKIGTDPAQANVLSQRTVDIEKLNIEKEKVCGVQDGKLTDVPVKSIRSESFALALGLAVEKTTERYYRENNIEGETRDNMNGRRPNCLRASRGYKARPLNGIWATAPFLHNGSVANLYEMLVPASERTKILYLGYREFDPKKVGYISTMEGGLPNRKRLTKVIVSGPGAQAGNLNTGHEFRDEKGPGVIGDLLSEEQRWALVDFMKTL